MFLRAMSKNKTGESFQLLYNIITILMCEAKRLVSAYLLTLQAVIGLWFAYMEKFGDLRRVIQIMVI